MDVFDDMIARLAKSRQNPDSTAPLEASIVQGELEVSVTAKDFDRLGIQLHQLRVKGPGQEGPILEVLEHQNQRLNNSQVGPLRNLKAQEVDPHLRGSLLRTQPTGMNKGYFYEARLQDGQEIELSRHRKDVETRERSEAPFFASEELFTDLVEALTDALTSPQEVD